MLRTVLLEVEWVLCGAYEFPPEQIIPALYTLAGLLDVSIAGPALDRKSDRLGRGQS